MTAPKLSESLATNVPLMLTLHKRGKSYPNKFKEGEFNYMYVFVDASGKEYVHFASTREEDTLKLFDAGQKLQVVRKEATGDKGRYYFLEWTPPDGAEARTAATPTLRSNSQQQTVDHKQDDYELEKLAHDFKLGLAGIVQAQISAGLSPGQITDGELKGKSGLTQHLPVGMNVPGENLYVPAAEWVRWIRNKSLEMAKEASL